MKINLIPEVKKEQLKIKTTNLWVTNVAIAIAIFCGATLLLLGIFIAGTKVNIKSTESETAKLETTLESYKTLEATVISIEQGVREVGQILANEDKWPTVFTMIEGATPDDIRFKSLDISADLNVTAELEGKDINSIDRFIKSFSSFKV